MSGEMERWADEAMYLAEPDNSAEVFGHVEPCVTLVSMTANPLRVMASATELYRGRVVRRPDEISRETAENWLTDMTRTTLSAGLEFIDLHFLIEGVTRAFTHQLVRQRTAVFVQESQRFAVKADAQWEVAMPPTIAALADDDPRRVRWAEAVIDVTHAYNALVSAGVPAEDARSLLPTNITTRIHYKTNLRNLADHAGMRLCSQAQAEWKNVWARMIHAIQSYGPIEERWQQEAIGRLFKPVCFLTGKCEFMAATDRWCAIRERVEAHHAAGDPVATWVDIDPMEPLREGAARRAS
jgi:flavin-dependent thymidylate synthase